MDWQEPDDVPTEQLNKILWRNSVGTQYPIWKNTWQHLSQDQHRKAAKRRFSDHS
jgi:hypothetical protein